MANPTYKARKLMRDANRAAHAEQLRKIHAPAGDQANKPAASGGLQTNQSAGSVAGK